MHDWFKHPVNRVDTKCADNLFTRSQSISWLNTCKVTVFFIKSSQQNFITYLGNTLNTICYLRPYLHQLKVLIGLIFFAREALYFSDILVAVVHWISLIHSPCTHYISIYGWLIMASDISRSMSVCLNHGIHGMLILLFSRSHAWVTLRYSYRVYRSKVFLHGYKDSVIFKGKYNMLHIS